MKVYLSLGTTNDLSHHFRYLNKMVCILMLFTLILSSVTTVMVIFIMFCIIFVYRTIQKWRPMVDKVISVLDNIH